ncbi:Uu.00g132690.m01.CDS01 [Anthostomella pinea]|uniref:Uu.00g132690.m01.CDS01 n=1 Tax=Anthostomella pinea TaxID=933095 RepID=A0AAI8YMS8_9PEZI|nr:Uu.00g132690.m01.CDS01 [Anthostomella pinea]
MGKNKLKNIKFHGIKLRETTAILDEVWASRDGTTHVQDPDVQDMRDRLSRMNGEKGGEMREGLDEAQKKGTRHSVNRPADEDLEGIETYIATNDEDENEGGKVVEKVVPLGADESSWRKYKHRQFIGRWGLLEKSDGKKDEEWWIPDPRSSSRTIPRICTKIEVHDIEWVLRHEQCAFCRLIRRKVQSDGMLDCEEPSKYRGCKVRLRVLDEGPKYALRLEVVLESRRDQTLQNHLILQRMTTESAVPLTGREVEDGTAMSKLKEWLHICETQHPQSNRPSLRPVSYQLRVIDVETWCVVEGLPSSVRYPFGCSALSRMPFEATNAVGIPYLWVDALCILQDNDEDKERIIMNMGSIYNNAALNIAATTNKSPADGLVCLSVARKSEQIVETVQDLKLAATFHDPREKLSDIGQAVWSSRGWTYQEQYLPSRTVYFTDTEICFTCPHSIFFETPTQLSRPITGPFPSRKEPDSLLGR